MKKSFFIVVFLLLAIFSWSQNQLWKAMRTSKGHFTGGFQQGAMDDAVGASLGDAIYIMGGTDNYTVYNHMFVSYNEGVNWEPLPNAPWQERNAMGIAGNVNGKIKMWGGNSNTREFRDSWEYDAQNGWVQISSDMGEVYGNRSSFAYVYTGTEFIVIGGNNFEDVIASKDLKTWTVRGLLPLEIQNTGGVTACYFNGSIYLTSGRNRKTGLYPGKVFRSRDAGATWEAVYDDESVGTSIFSNKWGNIVATKTAMIYIKGTTGETGGTNEKGCYVSVDGSNWKRMAYEPAARHATTVFASTNGRDAYMIMGNFHNDSWLFRQMDNVAQTAFLDSNCTYKVPSFSLDPNKMQQPAVGSVLNSLPQDSLTVQIFSNASGTPVLTQEFQLRFTDTLSPMVQAVNDTVLYLNKTCSLQMPDFTTGLQVKNECGSFTVTQTPIAGTTLSGLPDSIDIRVEVRDNSGNKTQEMFKVVVKDTLHPEIAKPESITLENKPGVCGAIAEHSLPQVSGTCAAIDLKSMREDEQTLQDLFPVGETKIYWMASTPAGYADTATQLVVVKDTEMPVLHVPAQVEFCPNTENRYYLPAAEISDNCSITSITYHITGATERSGNGTDASGYFASGISKITWRVMDASGNVAEAITEVRLRRLVVSISAGPPVFSGADLQTIYHGYGPDSLLIAASVQNGLPPFTYQWNSGDSTPLKWVKADAGSMNYTVAVTDARGCSNTAAIFITVKDIRCGENQNKVSLCWHESGRLTTLCVTPEDAADYLSRGALPGVCSGNFPEVTVRYPSEEVKNKLHLLAAPNPTEKEFLIKVESFEALPVQLRLFNSIGALLEEKQVMPGSMWQVGKNYPVGLYILQAQQGTLVTLRKLIKKSN